MANFMGLLVARHTALERLPPSSAQEASWLMLLRPSMAAFPRAMECPGSDVEALRLIPVDAEGRMRLDLLERVVLEDQAKGLHPFLVVARPVR